MAIRQEFNVSCATNQAVDIPTMSHLVPFVDLEYDVDPVQLFDRFRQNAISHVTDELSTKLHRLYFLLPL